MRSARDWEAYTISEDPWPWLAAEDVAALRMPCLMLSADGTVPLHRFVDDMLARTLRHVERVRIPDATHDMWSDQPAARLKCWRKWKTRSRTCSQSRS